MEGNRVDVIRVGQQPRCGAGFGELDGSADIVGDLIQDLQSLWEQSEVMLVEHVPAPIGVELGVVVWGQVDTGSGSEQVATGDIQAVGGLALTGPSC